MMHYHRSAFKLIPNVTIKEYMNSLLQWNHTLPCTMKLNRLQFKLHTSAGLITECLVKVSFQAAANKVSFSSARFPFKQQLCLVFNKQQQEFLQLWQQQTRFPFFQQGFLSSSSLLLFGFQQASARVAKYILTLCNSGSSKHKIVGNIASWNFITRAAHFWHTLTPKFKNPHIFTKHPKLNPYFLEASFLRN